MNAVDISTDKLRGRRRWRWSYDRRFLVSFKWEQVTSHDRTNLEETLRDEIPELVVVVISQPCPEKDSGILFSGFSFHIDGEAHRM